MAQVRDRIDAMTLNLDIGNWKEQLHLISQRRQHRGWQLVAIFRQDTAGAEGMIPLVNKASLTVTLLFQRRHQKPPAMKYARTQLRSAGKAGTQEALQGRMVGGREGSRA